MKLFLRSFVYCLTLLICWIPASAQTADFTFTPDGSCAPGLVSFTDASGPGVLSWSWNFGNSNTSTTQNPSTTYGSAGVYNVSLTITTATGTSTKTQSVTVYGKPTVSFTAVKTADCAPFTTSFTATATLNGPGPGTYVWDFGDGNTGTGATVAHTYALPGTYSVNVRAINAANCDETSVRNNYITAYSKPVAGFVASQTTFCTAPGVPTFTNTSSGGRSPYTSTWLYGDNTTGTGNTSTKTYSANGYYTVTMIATDANGCKDTSVSPNYIGVVGQAATFTSPPEACENQDVNFTNMTSGAISSTTWDFGDLTPTTNGNLATHLYSAAGTYTVTMTTIISGCTKTATKTIIIHPNPTVSISQFPSIPCPPPVPITFTANSVRTGYTISSYVWTTAQGTYTGQSIIDTFKRIVPESAPGTVKLMVISANGCRDSARTDTVMVRSLYVNVTPGSICPDPVDTVRGCDPLTETFGTELYSDPPPMSPPCTYTRYPAVVTAWLYKFSDGSPSSTSPRPTHRFSPSGDYRVDCRIITSNGCIDSSWRMVHVDTPVKPDFYAAPLDVCPKNPVTIFNTTANPLPGTRYAWMLEPGDTTFTVSNTLPSTIRVKRHGFYTVRVVSNHFGCIDSFVRTNYIRVRPPAAEFNDSIFCFPNLGAKFFNLSDSATSYLWIFGDGTTSTDVNPSHQYATTGDYTVVLVAYNSVYNCTDTFRKKIHIFRPDISFVSDKQAVCRDEFVTFEGAFGGVGEIKYSWRLGNYRTGWDTARLYTRQYTVNGYETVTLFAISGNNCLDSFTRVNYILTTRPTAMFTATPHVGCEPMDMVYSDNSTNTPGIPAAVKIWVLGNGDSILGSVAQTVPYRYVNRGIYTPKLIITDSLGCTDSLIQNAYIQVYKPDAVFTVNDDSVCKDAPVFFRSFTVGKTPLRHDWTFGDNVTGTGDTITHRYRQRGSFPVRLIVTDSVGCRDTVDRTNNIVVSAPIAAFKMSDSVTICKQLPVQFTNQSIDAVPTGYFWDLGGVSSRVENPFRNYANSGIYNIVLVATDISGCTDTARSQVRLLGNSDELNYTPLLGCAPMEVSFSTPIPGIPILVWDFGDGNTATTTNSAGTTYRYQNPGSYLPKVLFSNGQGCTSLGIGLDTIRVDKLSADFTWTTPCEGVPFTLSNTSTGIYSMPDSFSWAFAGSAATRSGPTPQYTYASAGSQAVTLTVRNPAGCTASITKNVFINPSPDLNAMTDTAICPGDTAMLRAGNAVTYTWSASTANPGAWLSCTNCQFPRVAPGGVPARYVVTATDANGCVGHDSTQVVIQIKTTSSIGDGGSICLGESFRLRAAGAQKYEWMPATSVDSPFIASPLATPRQTTTYIVAAQEGTCLIDSQRVTVTVNASPDFSAGQDQIIALGSAATLQPKGTFTRISWLNADTTLSCWDCRNPNANPHYTRTYVAEAENEWGCKTRDSVTVFVRCNGSQVFIPNTFTPNGDGENDYFFPQGVGFSNMLTFRVFNRWGELLFEARNVPLNAPRSGWDGYFKGQPMIPDTYVYSMTGLCPTGEVVEFKGDVSIIR